MSLQSIPRASNGSLWNDEIRIKGLVSSQGSLVVVLQFVLEGTLLLLAIVSNSVISSLDVEEIPGKVCNVVSVCLDCEIDLSSEVFKQLDVAEARRLSLEPCKVGKTVLKNISEGLSHSMGILSLLWAVGVDVWNLKARMSVVNMVRFNEDFVGGSVIV
jgi:hypothetical protein